MRVICVYRTRVVVIPEQNVEIERTIEVSTQQQADYYQLRMRRICLSVFVCLYCSNF